VRPFSPCSNWAVAETTEIAVYRKLEELQRDLPKLLSEEPPLETENTCSCFGKIDGMPSVQEIFEKSEANRSSRGYGEYHHQTFEDPATLMKTKTCECGVSFSFEGRSRKFCPACTARSRAESAARANARQVAQRKSEAELYAGLGRALAPVTVRTLAEVGDILGISAERVRQIERAALWKLRHKLLEAVKVEQVLAGKQVVDFLL
jgi:hypothetical protein